MTDSERSRRTTHTWASNHAHTDKQGRRRTAAKISACFVEMCTSGPERSRFNHPNRIIQMISNIYSMLSWSQDAEEGPNERTSRPLSLRDKFAGFAFHGHTKYANDGFVWYQRAPLSCSLSLPLFFSFPGQLTVHSVDDAGARVELRRIVTEINICACHQKRKRKRWIFIGKIVLAGGGYCSAKKSAKTANSWGWWFSYTCLWLWRGTFTNYTHVHRCWGAKFALKNNCVLKHQQNVSRTNQ